MNKNKNDREEEFLTEALNGNETQVSFEEEADCGEPNPVETDYVEESPAEADYMDELMQSKKQENQPSLAQKRGQDERAMIREQERLAQERRRRKRHKRRNIIIAAVVVVFAVGVWFIGWGYNLIFGTSAAVSTVEIVVESGQVVVYAKLTSVKGNEITYTVAEAVETAEATDGEMPSEGTDTDTPSDVTESGTESGAGDGETPEGFDSDSLPEGFDSSSMPDAAGSDAGMQTQDSQSSRGSVKAESMALVSTETTAGSSVAAQASSLAADSTGSYTATSLGMGGMDSGTMGSTMGGNMGGDMGSMGDIMGGSSDFSSFDFSSFGDTASGTVTSSLNDTFTYNEVTYQLTEETDTMLIPVGTDVTTRLGTVTTFARLSAGDCVALVMQEVNGEDVIMAVYIIG